MRWLLLSHDSMKVGFPPFRYRFHLSHSLPNLMLCTNSPIVTKEKRQTQGDEEYGEPEDENRRDAAPFISPNRGPCGTT